MPMGRRFELRAFRKEALLIHRVACHEKTTNQYAYYNTHTSVLKSFIRRMQNLALNGVPA